MILTGRRDEWVVRLPGALAGVATVALIYILGRRTGGRALGLASAFVLCSMGFFVGEMRQASNDCLLVPFATLALYAAYRRLHDDNETRLPGEVQRGPRTRVWNLVFHTALGLGFLTKGPVILLLVGVTLVPYLAFARRLTWGLRRLYDGWGLLIFVTLSLGWPAAVLLDDPGAAGLVAGDVGKDWSFAHFGAPLAFSSGGAVARFSAPVDAHRRCRGPVAFTVADRRLATRPSRIAGPFILWRARVGHRLVRLVVGCWKPRRVLYLGGRQAELLHPLPARNGLADRRDLVAVSAGGPRL